MLPIVEEPWYADGLRFSCTGCGKCCGGSPGFVWVTDVEIEMIARFLDLPLQIFADRYLRRVGQQWSLREDGRTFDCLFLKDNQCQIYETRPEQCRTFPFWKKLLDSADSWERAKTYCEGIRDEATLYSLEQIRKIANDNSIS